MIDRKPKGEIEVSGMQFETDVKACGDHHIEEEEYRSILNSDTLGRRCVMIIRKMTMDDYDEAFEMWLQTAKSGVRAIEDSREGVERFLGRNPDTSFIAEADGRIVGVLMCGHDGRRGYIYHTAIRDPGRSRAIGGALLDAVEVAMKENGITKIGLLIDVGNDEGAAFWARLGWTRRDDLIYYDRVIR